MGSPQRHKTQRDSKPLRSSERFALERPSRLTGGMPSVQPLVDLQMLPMACGRGISPADRRAKVLAHKGATQYLTGWAHATGISFTTISRCIALGWPSDRAFAEPPNQHGGATPCQRRPRVRVSRARSCPPRSEFRTGPRFTARPAGAIFIAVRASLVIVSDWPFSVYSP